MPSRSPAAALAVLLLGGLLGGAAAQADTLEAVQVLRAGGCGGRVALAPPLRHSAALDELAAAWSRGGPLEPLARSRGYAGSLTGVHVRAADATLLAELRRSQCAALTGRALREAGAYRHGDERWLIVSTAAAAPAMGGGRAQEAARAAAAPAAHGGDAGAALAERALSLVNEARARGARCGSRSFASVPPLSLSGTLGGVAYGHASDMAEHHYFEHQDLSGHTPAERVRASGYREQLVGENIAYGPQTVDEAVAGWLQSPEHCENIMDPRFAQMGVAFAPGRSPQHGLYWVQVLAAPRA